MVSNAIESTQPSVVVAINVCGNTPELLNWYEKFPWAVFEKLPSPVFQFQFDNVELLLVAEKLITALLSHNRLVSTVADNWGFANTSIGPKVVSWLHPEEFVATSVMLNEPVRLY